MSEKLEAYIKPQSNQILDSSQLRCLKQGNLSMEEFVTKTKLLIDNEKHTTDTKEETLRDILVFGLKSDRVRSDAINFGNPLIFK